MNKNEKIICFLLGLALVWCFMSGTKKPAEPKEEPAVEEQAASAETTTAEKSAADAAAPDGTNVVEAVSNAVAVVEAAAPKVEVPALSPEETVVLENDELRLELSSYGAVVKKATLKQFATGLGAISEENPAQVFDYSRAPLGLLADKEAPRVYAITAADETSVTFATNGIVRTYTLGADYKLTLKESFDEAARKASGTLCLGAMARGAKDSDLLELDHCEKGGSVVHHISDGTPVKALLAGQEGGCAGCGAAPYKPDAPIVSAPIDGQVDWLAIKNRFFMTGLTETNGKVKGFDTTVLRQANEKGEAVSTKAMEAAVALRFDGEAAERETTFFIGPKKQALLSDLGMRDAMDFGMWRWICYPVVWLLNVFHSLIPNYGVAVILLTILVRLIFWPLTRKSTEGMKKMQEIQPLLKDLQKKYKDNPQRLQQETFALYREKKVNPLSSCLPMLIQIPVFIALFNVLRASVELRYAGFLWIADLSEPEHLFAGSFPLFGGLNILPILMAVTMYVQSKLTPSAGDPNQQKMMTVFMPILMLVMFYNFASALSLYWTLSQVMSIIQMWMIRRQSQKKAQVFEPEVIDPPTPTRQQRRHT